MVPGSGFTCGVITPDNPCQINGIVTERNGNYVDGGVGFIESPGIQFDPRFGMAFALNPKTVIRAGVGAFHDGTGGPDFRGGPAFEFNRVINYTDMDSYLTGTGSVSPINVSGIEREDQKRPVSYRYQVGFERELSSNIVVNLAYVGDTTRNIPQNWNYNQIPAGAQFLPENRDATRPGFGHGRPPAEQAEPRRAARRVPAPDPRLRRHQHQQADRPGTLRFAAAAGEPPVHRRLRAGGELHLREGLGDRPAPEQPAAVAASAVADRPAARGRRQLHRRHPERDEVDQVGAGALGPRRLAGLRHQLVRHRRLVERDRHLHRQLQLLGRRRDVRNLGTGETVRHPHPDRRRQPVARRSIADALVRHQRLPAPERHAARSATTATKPRSCCRASTTTTCRSSRTSRSAARTSSSCGGRSTTCSTIRSGPPSTPRRSSTRRASRPTAPSARRLTARTERRMQVSLRYQF